MLIIKKSDLKQINLDLKKLQSEKQVLEAFFCIIFNRQTSIKFKHLKKKKFYNIFYKLLLKYNNLRRKQVRID